jgi:hypothetical protein
MVVRLDLERNRQPVAEVEHTGVLAGPLQDALTDRGQPLEEAGRMLVPAVLRPEEGEDRELEVVRGSVEQLSDAIELVVGKAEAAVQRFRD